jgi:hypothetical protein
MKFHNVTEAAGLAGAGYCHGAAAADYDNDADTDLCVAGVGSSRLYRNLGNSRFEDVTAKAGTQGRRLGDRWAAGSTTTTTGCSNCSSRTT